MKIVVDSGCDFTSEMKNKDGINIERVPLTLQLEEKEYIDDDNLNIDDYLSEMKSIKNPPKTAAPSPGLYLDKFKGEDSIFAVTLSSQLSASHNNAIVARDLYYNEIGSKFIHVFDSLSASVGECLIALKINEHIKNNLKEIEIVDKVSTFIKEMKTYFILECYDNLVKNGRMSPYMAKIGEILSIRPICTAIDGKIELAGKARGTKKAMAKLVDIIASENIDFKSRILGISHVKCPEKALSFKEEVMKRVPFKDCIILETSGLCSTYADNGGLIISY